MGKIGIDISTYDRNINYDELVKNVDFVILRAGFGVSYLPNQQKDVMFETHYKNLSGRVPLGVYYYAYGKRPGDGTKEAENCLRYIEGKTFELPIYYDLEDHTNENINTLAREWVDKIRQAGRKPGIYTYLHWIRSGKINIDAVRDSSIWIAAYGKNDGNIPSDTFKPNMAMDIWQYSSAGRVNGNPRQGHTDVNLLINDGLLTGIETRAVAPIASASPSMANTNGGNEVIREIQNWLNLTYNTGIAADNLVGPQTRFALRKAYQEELNRSYNGKLNVDGVVGPLTLAKTPILKVGSRGNIVKIVQAMLTVKGYNTNGVEGIYGQGTANAVGRLQADKGLSADRVYGPKTASVLFA